MWRPIIGIEVHAAVLCPRKVFSRGRVVLHDEDPTALIRANSLLRGLDVGLPGVLPVYNRLVTEQAIAVALALGSTIQARSTFDRKHYAYLDLPAGYQITQKYLPVALGGRVLIRAHKDDAAASKEVGVERIQIEQDSGKSVHDMHPFLSLVDYNRAGIGLLEIVSRPDIHSAHEAVAYVVKLNRLLQYCGASEALLEQGSMRCDVNVSVVRSDAADPLSGTRCEVKNLGSPRFVGKAVDYEIQRQIAILEAGGVVQPETRGFCVDSGATVLQRVKSGDTDYRYMPDPDLPPLLITAADVDRVAARQREHPDALHRRFVDAHQLSAHDAALLVERQGAAGFYEQVVDGLLAVRRSDHDKQSELPGVAKEVAGWMVGEVFANMARLRVDDMGRHARLAPAQLAELLELVRRGVTTVRSAKLVLRQLVDDGDCQRSAEQVVDALNLRLLVLPRHELVAMCRRLIDDNPKAAAEYRAGKYRKLKFFAGEIMAQTQGRADPQLITNTLKQLLDQEDDVS